MRHTELTNDLQERASLYAAGAMTQGEREEYARHLEEDLCAVCATEVRELQATASLIAFAAAPATPSPNVRSRLLEQAGQQSPQRVERSSAGIRWLQWITTAVAIASIAVAVIVSRTNSELRHTTDELNSRIAQLEVQLASQRSDLAMLTSAGVHVVDLAGQGDSLRASARIFIDPQRKQSFFYVRDLAAAPPNKSYQLWFVPKVGNPINAGVFNTQSDGTVRVEVTVPSNTNDLKAAAVTTEPFGGSPAPTGPFALLGAL
jgi:anti-sigma-K factor RskA